MAESEPRRQLRDLNGRRGTVAVRIVTQDAGARIVKDLFFLIVGLHAGT